LARISSSKKFDFGFSTGVERLERTPDEIRGIERFERLELVT
jgi:hypothetical protein